MMKCCRISYILVITCSFRICHILPITNDNKIAPFIFIAGSVAIEHLRVAICVYWTCMDLYGSYVWTGIDLCGYMCILDLYGPVWIICMDLYRLVWIICMYLYGLCVY